MSAGPGGPSPGPDSRCGFSPIATAGAIVPGASSDEVAARIYAFLEADGAPEQPFPAIPSPDWAARLAKSILDAHFAAGTAVPGLQRFLEGYLNLRQGAAPIAAPGVWATKLADPDATLATLLAEPTGEPHRFGIFTEPEVLALHPSISPRGAWLVDRLLCQPVPPPPPIVQVLPPAEEGVSKRQLLERELLNPTCSGCHNLMDPVAFSLEHFDEAGDYRELDNGVPVDASGTLQLPYDNSGNEPPSLSFDDFEDLAPQLAESCHVARCFSGKLSGYAAEQTRQFGFTEAEANQVANAFADSGFSVRSLVEAIVTNRAFFR